jgi:hypothetical protein
VFGSVASGCATEALLNPAAGVHTYVLPPTAALPIVIDGVVQVIILSTPAFAEGRSVSIVTVAASVEEHPFAVFVTVTVYVPGVLAIGCAIAALLNPAAGDHAYVLPATAAVPIVKDGLLHVSTLSAPALAAGAVVF